MIPAITKEAEEYQKIGPAKKNKWSQRRDEALSEKRLHTLYKSVCMKYSKKLGRVLATALLEDVQEGNSRILSAFFDDSSRDRAGGVPLFLQRFQLAKRDKAPMWRVFESEL